ncbi:MAG: hypothetical protein GWM90_30290 [Gemmatimonadetes bacterium]|nr:hypothetical protein [Gemmatimonadota bacterium]NIQ59426.1 hypothetical protein [Gemmatimonadota bacterium]NIU79612.1 hypothetical protein [Gammaproteobacteria bacterium]NIX48195.1 hypothetical protein [Gemmatimonadota bacterium]NIY12622.1 hypothetical protein [Gemmatimonadota bacterium]
MKLCIPTTSDEGLAAPVSGHFGRAPFYSFVDTESGAVDAVPNPGHEAVHPPDLVLGHTPGAVAVRGMGRGAYRRLSERGVRVLATGERDVESTLRAYRAGELKELDESELHAGGHH